MRILPFIIISLSTSLSLFIGGCSHSLDSVMEDTHVSENPSAEEILEADPEADIFQLEGVIYQTGIDWVEELTLTKDQFVGEIKSRNDTHTNFEDEMATKLPVGAKIYTVEEGEDVSGPILLVETNGSLLSYYGLVEG